jgi:hypothetical protein
MGWGKAPHRSPTDGRASRPARSRAAHFTGKKAALALKQDNQTLLLIEYHRINHTN